MAIAPPTRRSPSREPPRPIHDPIKEMIMTVVAQYLLFDRHSVEGRQEMLSLSKSQLKNLTLITLIGERRLRVERIRAILIAYSIIEGPLPAPQH
jgi:hypothetical protein